MTIPEHQPLVRYRAIDDDNAEQYEQAGLFLDAIAR